MKNPEVKAKELVDEYRNSILSFLSDNMKDKNAKICAVIAVNFALENPLNTRSYNEYLQEVKIEIESYENS